MKKAQDPCALTDNQLHEKKFCEVWVIAFFGATAKDKRLLGS